MSSPFKEVRPSDIELSESSEPSNSDPLIGSMLGERLKILARVGSGGMSVVYKAEDLLLNRIVAVKILHSHSALKQNNVLRFRQEAKSASKIDHENVIRIFEFNVPEIGQPYLVMDFIEGESLADFIANNGPIELKRAISLMSLVCDGMQCAHDAGVIHRDLKPSNIMLLKHPSGKQTLKVVDFGIAKLLVDETEMHSVTQTGEVFGSPLYMSPEQCWGKKLDGRSDVYSLACVMFEMCTGQPPLRGTSALETIHLHTTEPPPPVSSIYPGIKSGAALDAVFAKGMAKAPEARYQSPAEFKVALREILVSSDGDRHGDGFWSKSKFDMKKVKLVLMIAAVSLACFLIVSTSFSPTPPRTTITAPIAVSQPQPQPQLQTQPETRPQTDTDTDESNSTTKRRAVTEPAFITPQKWRVFLSRQLPSTTKLDLRTLGVSDRNLEDLQSFKNLRSLDLTGEPITDAGMKTLARLAKLDDLRLSNTVISDEGVKTLANKLQLKMLRLGHTNITNKSLSYLESMPLTYLLLTADRIDDNAANSLAKLKDLEVLSLRDTHISDPVISALSSLNKLVRLDIQNTRITDLSLKTLSEMKNLRAVRVHGCRLSNQAVDEFREHSLNQPLQF